MRTLKVSVRAASKTRPAPKARGAAFCHGGCGGPALAHEGALAFCGPCFYVEEVCTAEGVETVDELKRSRKAGAKGDVQRSTRSLAAGKRGAA